MNWTDLKLRLHALGSRRRAERELDDELQFHLEMEARKLGSADAARRAFGGVEQVREECRDVRGLSGLENLARDVRYGVRLLRQSPLFTAVAVLSLAIGIGANTAIFSLIDALLLRMLPVRSPKQLVVLHWRSDKDLDLNSAYSSNHGYGHGGFDTNVFSLRVLSAMRSRARTLDSVFFFAPLPQANVVANGHALAAGGMFVSGNYFAGLGARMLLGRPVADDDDNAAGLPAVVISYRFWERAFGRSPGAVGKAIVVNGQPCTVVGVTPREFFGVSAGGLNATPEIDLTLPIRARLQIPDNYWESAKYFDDSIFWIQAMGRLKTKAISPAVSAELSAILVANLPEAAQRQVGQASSTSGGLAGGNACPTSGPCAPQVVMEPGGRGLTYAREAYGKSLLILAAVAALTLLMACANLATMLLARAASRRREILMRLALGAKRARVVRQLLVEGALLAAAGMAAGTALARWGVRVLVALEATGQSPIALDPAPDGRVLAFTTAVAVLTVLLFALAPALRATRVEIAEGLKGDAPTRAARLGGARLLLAVQFAAALLLASAAR